MTTPHPNDDKTLAEICKGACSTPARLGWTHEVAAEAVESEVLRRQATTHVVIERDIADAWAKSVNLANWRNTDGGRLWAAVKEQMQPEPDPDAEKIEAMAEAIHSAGWPLGSIVNRRRVAADILAALRKLEEE